MVRVTAPLRETVVVVIDKRETLAESVVLMLLVFDRWSPSAG